MQRAPGHRVRVRLPMNWREPARLQRWRQWAGRCGATLVGHVLLVELLFALPLFLLMCGVNHLLGILTPTSLRHAALVWALMGAFGGAIVWRVVTLPLERSEHPPGNSMYPDARLGAGEP